MSPGFPAKPVRSPHLRRKTMQLTEDMQETHHPRDCRCTQATRNNRNRSSKQQPLVSMAGRELSWVHRPCQNADGTAGSTRGTLWISREVMIPYPIRLSLGQQHTTEKRGDRPSTRADGETNEPGPIYSLSDRNGHSHKSHATPIPTCTRSRLQSDDAAIIMLQKRNATTAYLGRPRTRGGAGKDVLRHRTIVEPDHSERAWPPRALAVENMETMSRRGARATRTDQRHQSTSDRILRRAFLAEGCDTD